VTAAAAWVLCVAATALLVAYGSLLAGSLLVAAFPGSLDAAASDGVASVSSLLQGLGNEAANLLGQAPNEVKATGWCGSCRARARSSGLDKAVAAARGVDRQRRPPAPPALLLTPTPAPKKHSPPTHNNSIPRYQSTVGKLSSAFNSLKALGDPNTCPKGCIPTGSPSAAIAGAPPKCLCVGATLDRARGAARDAGGALLPAVIGLAMVFAGATYLLASGAGALAVAGRVLRERRRLRAKGFGPSPGPRLMPQVRAPARGGLRCSRWGLH
jgi:hypothetical protein